jgi:hypothetical protein
VPNFGAATSPRKNGAKAEAQAQAGDEQFEREIEIILYDLE